ncbi:MAG TPA: DNA internalization-related competence protein ComEC/Rec2 [Ignavibacteriales bacterium]|nr:DNA internalization-related competence protein ComEC/Rec2 [Ignavibacteriales bacterium]
MKDYPAIRICLLFISGIILQKIFALDSLVLFFSAAILLLISTLLLLTKQDLMLIFSSYLVVAAVGALSYSLSMKDIKPYPFKIPKLRDLTLLGKIQSVDLKRDYEIRFLVDTDSVRFNGRTYPLEVSTICRMRDEKKENLEAQYDKVSPGDYVSLRGTFSKGRQMRNPGEFDYQKYLEERGISAVHTAYSTADFSILSSQDKMPVEDFLFRVRKSIDHVFYEYQTKACASLLRGFLLADRSEVEEDVQTDFINTGVVHILAVSGSNVVLIIMIFTLLLGRFNIVVRSVITLLGLFLFLIITGSTPSVLRAVIMGAVAILAFLTNRSGSVFNLLAIAALIILAINPAQLFDAGFQLSFSAVLSIVVIYPHLKSLLDRLKLKSAILYKVLLFLSVTVAAEIGVLPFTVFYFGKVSIVSLPANLLVIPLAGIISALGIVTLVLSIILPFLASVYAGVNNVLSDLLISITHWLGNLRLSYLALRQFSLADLIISYTFICGYFLVIKKLDSLKAKAFTAILTALNIAIFSSIDNKNLLPDNELSILAIDVGQGDATLVRFPDKTTALIDAGPSTEYFDSGEKTILPLMNLLGIDKIDYGFISHLDNDHYAGFMALLKKGAVRKIFKPAFDRTNHIDLTLEHFLRSRRIPVLNYRKGSINFGNSKVYILNPGRGENMRSLNDRSGVMKIVYGRTSFLFEGDAGKAEEEIIADKYGPFLQSDMLKLGHHGSKNSSSIKLLNSVRPSLGLISAGVMNRFGHPSKETLRKSRQLNIRLLRTDQEGAILLRSNGEKIKRVRWKE